MSPGFMFGRLKRLEPLPSLVSATVPATKLLVELADVEEKAENTAAPPATARTASATTETTILPRTVLSRWLMTDSVRSRWDLMT